MRGDGRRMCGILAISDRDAGTTDGLHLPRLVRAITPSLRHGGRRPLPTTVLRWRSPASVASFVGPVPPAISLRSRSAEGLKAALHQEPWPIACVRGLKSTLLIDPIVEINLDPFTSNLEADFSKQFFKSKRQGLTWSQLEELGAPRMEDGFVALSPMSYFIKKTIFGYNIFFFSRSTPLDA